MTVLSSIFENAKIVGVPLLLIVMGLVQYIKGFGLSGKAVKILSLAVGFLIGLGYQLSLGIPADFGPWFSATIFGLLLGLVASGVFDVLNPPSK